MCARVHVYAFVHDSVCIQDPPNGALECKMDGVARTTVVIISALAVMTDETGVMTLTYDAELVSMTRGGPTAANMTAAAEDVKEEVVVCDEDSGVSLYIDDVGGCPSPMYSTLPPPVLGPTPGQQVCYPGSGGCASGFKLENAPPDPYLVCMPYN